MPRPRKISSVQDIVFREMTDEDLGFVELLYASTRAEEVAGTGWPLEQQRAFLIQQHRAQHHHYRAHYPGAEWLVIEHQGNPIGRLYLYEQPADIRIVDISLIPGSRNRGIGEAILRDVLNMAAAAGKSVSVHVERNNRALRLYGRIGFRLVEDKGVYLFLAWELGHGSQ